MTFSKTTFARFTRLTHIAVLCALVASLNACSPQTDTLKEAFKAKAGQYPLNTKHLNEQKEPLYINRLVKQNSHYLLQHAHNPVQWWAWSDDAFAKAKELNKPIFLSIGYSTCHWCHVMARESFDNIEIANFINDNFIPIKVDREEHPDIDELYLTSVQMLSGKAGWPLTAILTPDGHAFFGGTYFSPQALLKLLNKVSDTWVNRQDAVLEQANRLNTALKEINQSSKGSKAITTAVTSEAALRIRASLAREAATNSKQAKPGFPREPEMLFLLSQAQWDLSNKTLSTIKQRLTTLASGGIHDQVGGGFHRYTVDSQWQFPHFEKMLYNQAQLGKAYFLAYQLSGEQYFKEIGDKTFDFLLNTMQTPEGGFFAALDAESKDANGMKSEGNYYTWSYKELAALLNDTELSLVESKLKASEQGNFNGKNVLQNIQASPTTETLQSDANVEAILETLRTERNKRATPPIDTKIISSWNAMAISALATGYTSTANTDYLAAAKKAANRIWQQAFSTQHGLARTIPNNGQRVNGTLEDYAYFANALLELYDIEGEVLWLKRSEQLAQQMIKQFHDADSGGFQIGHSSSTAAPSIKLVTARDDATFSGNSVAAQVLARLYRRTGNIEYKHTSAAVIAAFSKQLIANPEALSGMLLAADYLNRGEFGSRQYAAKGKVTMTTQRSLGQLNITIDIAEGWHINASKVLSEYLIPTRLSTSTFPSLTSCAKIEAMDYPKGKTVSLGFQEEDLLVYEGSVTLNATLPQHAQKCPQIATELVIQACTDEVCQSPEKVQIRSALISQPM